MRPSNTIVLTIVSVVFLSGLLGCGADAEVHTYDLPKNINADPAGPESSSDAPGSVANVPNEPDSTPDVPDSTPGEPSEPDSTPDEPLCDGGLLSVKGVDEMVTLTTLTESETVYTTFDRIDGIASLFEDCGDPWGMFPTTYRHITNRIIEAIEGEQIKDGEWGRQIVLDFASRYFANLQAALTDGQMSYAWKHYYDLARNADVSRTRAVVNAMVAHLTLDLPYALWAIGSTDGHEEDYFVLGELMIEITPNFIADLMTYYNTDAADILNGFFLGNWVDGAFGNDTAITLSYQTIRTKSWNNWRLINSGWSWIANSEIFTSFYTMDGVLATLDASGTID